MERRLLELKLEVGQEVMLAEYAGADRSSRLPVLIRWLPSLAVVAAGMTVGALVVVTAVVGGAPVGRAVEIASMVSTGAATLTAALNFRVLGRRRNASSSRLHGLLSVALEQTQVRSLLRNRLLPPPAAWSTWWALDRPFRVGL